MSGRRLALAVAALMVASCGGDEALLAPLDAGGALAEAGDAASEAPQPPDSGTPEAAALKRTVFQRNPFGDVEKSANLLWDGDFEWHSIFAEQYGWTNSASLTLQGAFDQVHVGPMCKSGMKCGFVTPSQSIAAVGVSPSGAKVSARVFGKPPTGDCLDLAVALFACDYANDPDVALEDTDGPDADGWCEYAAIADERSRATCLSVEARFVEGEALIDDAVVEAAPAGAKLVITARPVAAERARALAAERRVLHAWLRPGRKAPHPALAAYERWMGRRR